MLAQLIIPAAAGILGVPVGGLITFYGQRRERRHDHVRRQLECFYGPLVAMREEIRLKIELRVKLHGTANAEWQKKLKEVGDDPQTRERVEEARKPQYDKLFNYSDDQFNDEIIPLYRKMLEHFTQTLWLAEPSTLDHLGALVEFVEIWNRFLAKSLPHEVVEAIQPTEKGLYPFYEDLDTQTKKLRRELKK